MARTIELDAQRPFNEAFGGGIIVEGAHVRTPCGQRRIEYIRPGDLIVTRDNGLQPVRMIWMRRLSASQMRGNPDCAPVRLTPRAVGPMMPKCDLLLHPDHQVLIPGYRLADMPDTQCALISAAALAGSSDAAYIDRAAEDLRLMQLVFDSPQIFAVNGLPVASPHLSAETLAGLDPMLREQVLRQFSELRTQPEAYPPAEYSTVPQEAFEPLG